MSGRTRCDVCGKFRATGDLVLMEGEVGDGVWNECRHCMSEADREFYFAAARLPTHSRPEED